LVILDSIAYSENEKGPWVPMVKNTAVFKEPKRKHHEHDHHPHVEKLFTTQA